MQQADKGQYIEREILAEQVAEHSLPLYVEATRGYTLDGFGVELDPTFLTQKVGKEMPTYDGKGYVVQQEDWNKYICSAYEELQPQKVRVMFVDTYICSSREQFENKSYTWDSAKMKDLRMVLDLAQRNGTKVNLTFWGCGQKWLMEESYENWVTNAKPSLVKEACTLFADALCRLFEEGYSCIKEITFYNEPNYYFYKTYGFWTNEAYAAYVETLKILNGVFEEYGLKERLGFNMSDDSNDKGWMEYVLKNAGSYVDKVNTHQYYVKDDMTDEELSSAGYFPLVYMEQLRQMYGVPIVMNEFGVDNTYYEQNGENESFYSGTRALTLAEYLIAAMNHGVTGFTYWCLYPCHGADYFSLISFAENGSKRYLSTQFYYAYSLFSRLTSVDSMIYEISSEEEGICAIAFKDEEGKWSYFLVNRSENDRIISVANCFDSVERMDAYILSASVTYGSQIVATQTVISNGRIAEFALPSGSLVVLKQV